MIWRYYNSVQVGVSGREGQDKGVGKSISSNRIVDINHAVDMEDDETIVGNG